LDTHDIVAHIEGFSHIRSSYNHFPPIRIRTKPCLFILKNKYPPEEPDFSFTLRKHPVDILEEQATPPAADVEVPDLELTHHSETEGLLPDNSTEIPVLIQNV
jgi:hypothetical protein